MTSRRVGTSLLLASLAALAAAAPAAPRPAAAPPACLPAIFAVDGHRPSLLPDGSAAIFVLDPTTVRLGDGCTPARARIAGTRRFTTIAASVACRRIAGKTRVRLRVDARDCRTLRGRLDADRARVHARFTATRTEARLAGRVVPPAGAIADGDTADADAQDASDDGSTTPLVLAPGATAGGAAWASDDGFDDDWYAIARDGEPHTITLTIADPARSDLDLYLVDAHAHDLVPPSRGTGAVERLSTGELADDAFVVVSSAPGASPPEPPALPWTAYVLTVDGGGTPSAEAGDVGPVWVLVLDDATGSIVARTRTGAAADWQFAIDAPLLPGRYRVAAGTDRDGDGVLGDPGEAFGWWPAGDEPGGVLELAADASLSVDVPVAERPDGVASPLAR